MGFMGRAWIKFSIDPTMTRLPRSTPQRKPEIPTNRRSERALRRRHAVCLVQALFVCFGRTGITCRWQPARHQRARVCFGTPLGRDGYGLGAIGTF
jgi:hypothetical protein